MVEIDTEVSILFRQEIPEDVTPESIRTEEELAEDIADRLNLYADKSKSDIEIEVDADYPDDYEP